MDRCFDDPCQDIKCPDSSLCKKGQCVPFDFDSEKTNESTQEGIKDETFSNDNDAGEAQDTINRDPNVVDKVINIEQLDPDKLISSDIPVSFPESSGGPAAGCGCTSQPNSFSVLLLIGLFLLLWIRRYFQKNHNHP